MINVGKIWAIGIKDPDDDSNWLWVQWVYGFCSEDSWANCWSRTNFWEATHFGSLHAATNVFLELPTQDKYIIFEVERILPVPALPVETFEWELAQLKKKYGR